MSKTSELRLSDVRKIFRLVGVCRELGRHEDQWRRHSNEGIAKLLAARASNGGQINWARPRGIIHFEMPVVTGFSGSDAAVFAPFMRRRDPSQDPIFSNLGRVRGQVVTRCRQELVEDTAWYGSISFNDYRRVVGVDHCIYTLCKLRDANAYSLIGLHREVGDVPFSTREARLLHLFHEELGRLIGSVLVCDAEAEQLSPRLRQTLDCLLTGDSEKQVAIRLGLRASNRMI
jgi:hypothetical protein